MHIGRQNDSCHFIYYGPGVDKWLASRKFFTPDFPPWLGGLYTCDHADSPISMLLRRWAPSLFSRVLSSLWADSVLFMRSYEVSLNCPRSWNSVWLALVRPLVLLSIVDCVWSKTPLSMPSAIVSASAKLAWLAFITILVSFLMVVLYCSVRMELLNSSLLLASLLPNPKPFRSSPVTALYLFVSTYPPPAYVIFEKWPFSVLFGKRYKSRVKFLVNDWD